MATAKKLPSGSWRARAYAGKDEAGKSIYKSFTAPTKKEAELLAAQYVAQEARAQETGMRVGEAIAAYIELKKETLSPATVLNYKCYLKNHYAGIKDKSLQGLRAEDVQRFVSVEAATFGGKTVSNVYGLLSGALKVYRPDFSAVVTLPRKKKNKIQIPTAEQIAMYYNAVKGHPLEIPFLLASQCGLRASEAAAVRREDIRGGKLCICRARVRGDDGRIHEKEPKTEAGYRELPLTDELLRILLSVDRERLSLIDADQIPNRWAKFLKQKGLPPCGFHALRHYFASRAALAGVPKMYLVELMGHSSSRMLDQVYLHTFPDEKAQFAALLQGVSKAFFDEIRHEM